MENVKSHTKSLTLHYKVMMDTELNYNLTDASHVTFVWRENEHKCNKTEKNAEQDDLAKELANKNEIYSKNVLPRSYLFCRFTWHFLTEQHKNTAVSLG